MPSKPSGGFARVTHSGGHPDYPGGRVDITVAIGYPLYTDFRNSLQAREQTIKKWIVIKIAEQIEEWRKEDMAKK